MENKIKEEIKFDSIDSTQIYARKLIEERNLDHFVSIRADEQTGGIGRYDRKWISPKGVNLYVSFIFKLNYEDFSDKIFLFPIITCVSILQTLDEFKIKGNVKWVNDVLIDGKKVSGCLIESILQGEELFVIVGIGINVNMISEDFINFDQPATSMRIKTEKTFDLDYLYTNLKNKLLENIFNKNKEFFIQFYDDRIAFKNERVKILDKNGKEIFGILKGIDQNGYLLIENEMKEIITVYDGRLININN